MLLNELYENKIYSDLDRVKENVTSKINDFAQKYLSPEAYRSYLDEARKVVYEVSELPSKIGFYYDRAKNTFRRFVSGVLGYYDLLRNKIVLNRYLPKDEVESVLAHESVHQATRKWALEYFRRFGEAARPVIEGFTELITRQLGYYSRAYDEYVKAAEDTLRMFGYNTRQTLYDILNFRKSPESVLGSFYRSLSPRCCYA